jgi:hypothetical protein
VLRDFFDRVDPGLSAKVAKKTSELTPRVGPQAAFKKAIAMGFADGMARELVAIGQSGRPPRHGHVGLGCYGNQALDGWWDTVKGAAGDTWDFTKDAASFVGSAACRALNNPAAGIAAGAAGASVGVPPNVGAAGASMATSAACQKKGASAPPPTQRPVAVDHRAAATPGGGLLPHVGGLPILPLAIGGAVLAVLLLRK